MIMTAVDYAELNVERLPNLTAAVFLREATEFGAISIASYSVWLEAARHPRVRATIWSAIDDQNNAWDRRLTQLAPNTHPLASILVQCFFMGKLIRLPATGPHISDLAGVRSGFAHMLRGILQDRLRSKK